MGQLLDRSRANQPGQWHRPLFPYPVDLAAACLRRHELGFIRQHVAERRTALSTVVVKRSPRAEAPQMPEGQVELAEPPVLGEPNTADFGSTARYLPMGLGAGAMVLLFSVRGGGTTTYLTSGMMGVMMVSMMFSQIGRSGSDRQAQDARRTPRLPAVSDAAAHARRGRLPSSSGHRCCGTTRRRPTCGRWPWAPGCGNAGPRTRTSAGSGSDSVCAAPHGSSMPPQTKPIEDLEPLSAISLRRFTKAYRTVPGLPIACRAAQLHQCRVRGRGRRRPGADHGR